MSLYQGNRLNLYHCGVNSITDKVDLVYFLFVVGANMEVHLQLHYK